MYRRMGQDSEEGMRMCVSAGTNCHLSQGGNQFLEGNRRGDRWVCDLFAQDRMHMVHGQRNPSYGIGFPLVRMGKGVGRTAMMTVR